MSSREKLFPCCASLLGFSPNRAGPPLPAPAAWVTVTSVATPYSECSTVSCAARTPADIAETVTTRPMPSARPRATTTACRRLRRSSRATYVKNMPPPLPMSVVRLALMKGPWPEEGLKQDSECPVNPGPQFPANSEGPPRPASVAADRLRRITHGHGGLRWKGRSGGPTPPRDLG